LNDKGKARASSSYCNGFMDKDLYVFLKWFEGWVKDNIKISIFNMKGQIHILMD
jgi:hypothetical protein